jgi:predicted dehydrogenase
VSQAKVRVVAVGMGGRGVWAAGEFSRHPDFELVAIVDEVPVRMDMAAEEEKLAGVAKYRDLGRCLKEARFDALAVFTPDATHGELAVAALEAGRHVFVEKPLDVTAERLDRVIEADRRVGGRTFVGFNLRFAPMYARIHQLIAEGVAGRVLMVQADEYYDGGRTYFRRWNRLVARGGGLWITKGSHDFDLLYWMAGAEPESVSAASSLDYYKPRADAALYCRDCRLRPDCPDRYDLTVPPGSPSARFLAAVEQATGQKPDLCLFNSDKDTFDHGTATVRFRNNIIGTYTLSVVAGFSNRRMRVNGTRATIDGDLETSRITIRRRDPSSVEEIDATPTGADAGGHGGGDANLFTAFADFVRGRPAKVIRPTEAEIGRAHV